MPLAFYWIVTIVINYFFVKLASLLRVRELPLGEWTHCLNDPIRCLHRSGDNFLNYVIVSLLPNLQNDFALRFCGEIIIKLRLN